MIGIGQAALLGLAVTLVQGEPRSPWALIARHVIGRIEHMTQSSKEPAAPRYDVATVLLDADAGHVYATILRMIKANPEVTILSESDTGRRLEVARGQDSAGLTVTALGERLSQLLVAAVVRPGEASPASSVVDRVLAVCQQLKVKCSVAG
jgi:hypothetical protein